LICLFPTISACVKVIALDVETRQDVDPTIRRRFALARAIASPTLKCKTGLNEARPAIGSPAHF